MTIMMRAIRTAKVLLFTGALALPVFATGCGNMSGGGGPYPNSVISGGGGGG